MRRNGDAGFVKRMKQTAPMSLGKKTAKYAIPLRCLFNELNDANVFV